jgi:hypothetical protein
MILFGEGEEVSRGGRRVRQNHDIGANNTVISLDKQPV